MRGEIFSPLILSDVYDDLARYIPSLIAPTTYSIQEELRNYNRAVSRIISIRFKVTNAGRLAGIHTSSSNSGILLQDLSDPIFRFYR